jgi:hypothetical protein
MASRRSATTTIIPAPNAAARGSLECLQSQVHSHSHDGGRGIDLAPQDQRYLRREDVSQDAAG